MTINAITALVKDDFNAVNSLVSSKVQSQISLVEDLSKHIIQSGGKRLRPLLVLLASKACGYQGDKHIPMAATIELIHTATLLHDDVIDESTLRRGRKTAHSIWGSKPSILVGDYLFTLAMQLLIETDNLELHKLITDTAFKIICGEVKQLSNRNNPCLTFDEYFEVIRAKTSILFAAASRISGVLCDADAHTKNNLYNFGLHLGNAFQLTDDALDYCSDSETLGKNIGDDLADGKATLPILHALQHGTEKQQHYIKESLKKGSLAYLPEILIAIEETNAIEFTRKIAGEEVDSALSCLTVLPSSEYKDALIELANFSMNRDH